MTETFLHDILTRRFANPFVRCGIATMEQVVSLLESRGLSPLHEGTDAFRLFGPDTMVMQGAGAKAWAAKPGRQRTCSRHAVRPRS